MNRIPPSRPQQRGNLPIWDTVCASYRSVFVENLRFLPKAALAPALLLIAISFLLQAYGLYIDPTAAYQATEDAGNDAIFAEIPALLASFATYPPLFMLAVPWIRLTLLGAETAPPSLYPQWTGAHWRALGVVIIAAVVGLLVYLIGSIGMTVILVGLHFVGQGTAMTVLKLLFGGVALLGIVIVSTAAFLRLLLAIPASLAGQEYRLREIFRRSSGCNIALFTSFLLTLLPMMVVGFVPFFLSGGGVAEILGDAPYPLFYSPNGPYFPLLVLWNTILILPFTAVCAAFISIVYRSLFEAPPKPLWYGKPMQGSSDPKPQS